MRTRLTLKLLTLVKSSAIGFFIAFLIALFQGNPSILPNAWWLYFPAFVFCLIASVRISVKLMRLHYVITPRIFGYTIFMAVIPAMEIRLAPLVLIINGADKSLFSFDIARLKNYFDSVREKMENELIEYEEEEEQEDNDENE